MAIGDGASDSPLEQAAMRERARAGVTNATKTASFAAASQYSGSQESHMDFHTCTRERSDDGLLGTQDLQLGDAKAWTSTLMGSSAKFIDSDGTINVSKLISKDGENVGDWLAKKNADQKKGWGAMRAEKLNGKFLPNGAERVRSGQDQMVYSPGEGGWVPSSPTKTPSPKGNLNVRQGGAAANPFESRIFRPSSGAHYAVADKSDETYAYSGARGIFKQVDASSYVPEHYRREQAMRQPPAGSSSPPGPTAPGSDVQLKGGWPIDRSYGVQADGRYHTGDSGGWSIEKSLGARKDHALFTRVAPSS